MGITSIPTKPYHTPTYRYHSVKDPHEEEHKLEILGDTKKPKNPKKRKIGDIGDTGHNNKLGDPTQPG
jgi:hypothetical protein